MPVVAVGRLHLEHVLCMLDGIHKCSTPAQVARKDGRKWSFFYISYSTQNQVEDAVKSIRQFVSDTWAIYTKGPPFVCDGRELETHIFRVFVKNAPLDAYRREIVGYFERDSDLLAWDEINEVSDLQGFFVNFIDLEHAMKYVRLSEQDKLYLHGVRMKMRPQKNLVFILKLIAHMKAKADKTVTVEDVQLVAGRLCMQIGMTQIESLMPCMPSIFQKNNVSVCTTPSNGCTSTSNAFHRTYQLRVTTESLLANYSMSRVENLEMSLDAMRPDLSWLFKHTICVLAKAEYSDMLTVQSPVTLEFRHLVESEPSSWQVADILVALCTQTMRTAIRLSEMKLEIDGAKRSLSAMEVMEQNFKKINLKALEVDELVGYKRMRSHRYRGMLCNKQGLVSGALNAIHTCLDILRWNAFVTRGSFECMNRVMEHNFFAIVNYRDRLLSNTK